MTDGLNHTTVDDDVQEWRLPNGQLHRTDGPAVIWPDGGEEWYLHGVRHRTDGPAVIWPDQLTAWFQNDMLHRTDGPAIVQSDGIQEWWIDGKRVVDSLSAG